MTSEHIREVLEFMDRKSAKNRTEEEIIEEWKEIGLLDSDGNYTPPYRHLGVWIDECIGRGKKADDAQAALR